MRQLIRYDRGFAIRSTAPLTALRQKLREILTPFKNSSSSPAQTGTRHALAAWI